MTEDTAHSASPATPSLARPSSRPPAPPPVPFFAAMTPRPQPAAFLPPPAVIYMSPMTLPSSAPAAAGRGGGGAPRRAPSPPARRAVVATSAPPPTGGLSSAPAPTRTIRGLADLFPLPPAPRPYDALLLDQFGVLHDGTTAYPLAPAAVAAAAAAGVHLIILSNTSRRAATALAALPGLGFPAATPWAAAITSGELAAAELCGRPATYRGARVLHTNWVGRGGVPLGDAGLLAVGADGAAAELLLTHGTEGVTAAGGDGSVVETVPYDDLTALLTSVARQGGGSGGAEGEKGRRPAPEGLRLDPTGPPLLLCANPDLVTVDGAALRPMPGALAAAYEAAGGPVVRLGKPADAPYVAALATLAALGVADPRRVLAVGDSAGHDVLGAADAGIDSLYVAGGIDAERFGLAHGDAGGGAGGQGEGGGGPGGGGRGWTLDEGALAEVCEGAGLGARRPTYAMPFFRW